MQAVEGGSAARVHRCCNVNRLRLSRRRPVRAPERSDCGPHRSSFPRRNFAHDESFHQNSIRHVPRERLRGVQGVVDHRGRMAEIPAQCERDRRKARDARKVGQHVFRSREHAAGDIGLVDQIGQQLPRSPPVVAVVVDIIDFQIGEELAHFAADAGAAAAGTDCSFTPDAPITFISNCSWFASIEAVFASGPHSDWMPACMSELRCTAL